ncbi:MAG: fibronectin type III domain-containing protein [Clostridia bacterium]|nr:fibronectin type III domain-containing protein [Clostridia bacterium]
MTVNWAQNAKATGYQIQYATNSKFTSAKIVTVSGASTLSKTIASLTKGSTYFVRVRVYKTVSSLHYFSAWSTAKSVKIVK